MRERLSDKLPGSFQPVLRPALEVLSHGEGIERLWSKDHRLWKREPKETADRLGWLTRR